MVSPIAIVKCMYPGCGKWIAGHPKRQFCNAHSKKLLEVAKRQCENDPLFPPATPITPAPVPEQNREVPTSTETPVHRRVRSVRQRQIEVLKRKIARKAHEP